MHEPRTSEPRLTDHSALSLNLALRPVALLPVTVPVHAADAVT
ncbi:hypothetical protein ABT126_41640 [Streptomyces sp. NPDC002012]